MKMWLAISVVFGVLPFADAHAMACPVEPLSGALDVLGSPWKAHADIEVCGFLTSTFGKEEIWLKNKQTGEEVLVAEGDPGGETDFKSPKNGELDITVPNRSGIVSKDKKIDGLNVVFHFSPKDDPDDRRGFLSFYKDQHSKEGVEWYCKYIYGDASEAQKSRLNAAVGPVCREAPQPPSFR